MPHWSLLPTLSSRRRFFGRVALSILLILIVLVCLAVPGIIDAYRARSALTAVKGALTQINSSGQLTRQNTTSDLYSALGETDKAERILGGPSPSALSHVPIIGRSWTAERTVAESSSAAINALLELIGDSTSLGRASHVSLAALAKAHRDLVGADRSLAGPLAMLAALKTGLTPAQVGSGVAKAQQSLLPIGPDLRAAAAGAEALRDLYGGDRPHTIVIALENNAELRATGGLISSFAIAHTRDGHLHVGPFRDVDALTADGYFAQSAATAQRVPAPPDYVATYGRFDANSTLLKNVNDSPSGPDSGQVLSRIIGRALGVTPDAVMLLDAPAVADLADGAGLPVQLPDGGGTASGSDLVRDLLVGSYATSGKSLAAEALRRQQLEASAGDTVAAALSRAPSLSFLRALGEAVQGRHVMLWSSEPSFEKLLKRAGAAGDVNDDGGDICLVSVDNLGDGPGVGDKLDFYMHRSLDVHVVIENHVATVLETVSLHNAAPKRLGSYVEGKADAGELHELASFVIPKGVTLLGASVNNDTMSSPPEPIDGDEQVLTPVVTPRNATSTVSVEYREPIAGDTYHLRLIPQPLATPARLRVNIVGARSPDAADPLSLNEAFTKVLDLSASLG